MKGGALFSSKRHDWETPQFLFDALDAEFGFTLDACAIASNAKCQTYFTPEKNALNADWSAHRVFMNPPYGRVIGKWMEKAYRSSITGALVVCLVPARTDTDWWHRFALRGEVRFFKGRLKFNGLKKDAPFPCAVVIFRP